MTTTTIDISKTPVQLSELLSLSRAGAEVVIAEGDTILARLIPVAQDKPRIGSLHPHSIAVSDDFDAPLSDEFWTGAL